MEALFSDSMISSADDSNRSPNVLLLLPFVVVKFCSEEVFAL